MTVPTVKLNNGTLCPKVGLGTWLAAPGEATEVVKYAIDIGYRHIDCAWLYGNEKEIGEGIRAKLADKTVKREDLYIVTKLWNTFHEREKVVTACKESLKNFGLDYVDLYLIHWPCAQKITGGPYDIHFPFKNAVHLKYDFVETWKGMEECVRLGLTKSIGLSNFNSKQTQRILDAAQIKPVINQIEVNPNITQKKLIKFLKDRNIEVVAYSPFGSPARPWAKPTDPVISLEDPKLVNIGKKYGKTSAQVILRYLLDIGTIPIPKSANKERLKKNIEIFDFELTPEEIAVIDTYDCNGRAVLADDLKDSPDYPFKGVEY